MLTHVTAAVPQMLLPLRQPIHLRSIPRHPQAAPGLTCQPCHVSGGGPEGGGEARELQAARAAAGAPPWTAGHVSGQPRGRALAPACRKLALQPH